jgi:hypothetical protein
VERVAGDVLAERALRIKEIESRSTVSAPRPEVVSELVATAKAAEQEAEAPTRFYQNPGDSQVSGVAVPEGTNRSVVSNSVVTAPEYPHGEPISTASRGNATIVTQTPRSVNIALIALGGVALLFAGVATAALVVLARDRSAPPQAVVTPPSTPAAVPAAPPVAPPSSAATPPAASLTAEPAASSAAPSTATTTTAPPPSPKTTKTATATTTAPPRPPPKGDCDIPYTIGADGIKRPKAHCF